MLSMKEYHTTNHTTQSQLHITHLSQLHTPHSPNQHHIIPLRLHIIPSRLHIIPPHTTQNLLRTIQLLFTIHLQLLTISKLF